MSQRTLHSLFKPTSVAIIGASNTEKRAGNVLMKKPALQRFFGAYHASHP